MARAAVVPGGVNYVTLFIYCGIACLFILIIVKALQTLEGPKRKKVKGSKVAKVDMRGRYGDAMKRRAVKLEDLDDTTIQLLLQDGKLTQNQIASLKKQGKL